MKIYNKLLTVQRSEFGEDVVFLVTLQKPVIGRGGSGELADLAELAGSRGRSSAHTRTGKERLLKTMQSHHIATQRLHLFWNGFSNYWFWNKKTGICRFLDQEKLHHLGKCQILKRK